MSDRVLTALPIYNEEHHIRSVLPEVIRYSDDVLVVNDGSTDGSAEVLKEFPSVQVVHHEQNQGYGAALRTAFQTAQAGKYKAIVTIDCDGQHEPKLIPELTRALLSGQSNGRAIDMVSGSRYLSDSPAGSVPPADRRAINQRITAILNDTLHLGLTDAFCGFKAYRVASLSAFDVTELGYAMPLQHWVQAVAADLEIVEFPVPLVYLEEERSFGGSLDNAERRMRYYLEVLSRELCERKIAVPPDFPHELPCR